MLAVTSCLVPFLLLAHFSGASSAYFSNILRQEDSSCPADAQGPWSYRGDNGPDQWGETYEGCNGLNQSPININTEEVVQDPNLAPLQLVNYDVPVSSANVSNNGHTLRVAPNDDVQRFIEVEGSQYNLVEFHLHWGNESRRGSEHTFDNGAYAMELHFVHMNDADQIAVVGVLFKAGRRCNAELARHRYVLTDVKYRDQSIQLDNLDLNLNGLLPENPACFYRYAGSLTTPGCAEGVTWTVLKKYLHISYRQLKNLRQLHSDREEENNDACHIDNNHRPTQLLNGRIVTESQCA